MRPFLTKLQLIEFGELSEGFIQLMEGNKIIVALGLQAGEPLYTFSQLALLVFLEKQYDLRLTTTPEQLRGIARVFELAARDKLNTVESINATTFIREGERIGAFRGDVRTIPHPKMADAVYFRPKELWEKIRQKLGRTKPFRDMLSGITPLHA